MDTPSALKPAPPASPRSRHRLWLAGGAVAALALVAAAVLGGGGGAGDDGPAQTGLLQPADLATTGGTYVRTNPPVDLAAAEQLARASFGQIPLPAGRAIGAWQRPDSGHQVTQVVLHYTDPAQAAKLDGVVMAMLPNTLGWQPAAVDLPGAQDARLWRADNYQALTFRHGGFAVLIGTTDTADPDVLTGLAEQAVARLAGTAAAVATP